ncbi:MAG TPA: dienelactone hydrolase family protein [Candidatus Saccharimonadales bacterium]|nr:dienelactone hydrolase family protein [Candidatus Saccharimonadales bacterium]
MGEMIKINGLEAYLSHPQGKAMGAIIVIHEVWGLDDHIKSVADRLSNEGYIALAPELLAQSIDLKSLRGMQTDLFDPKKRNEVQPKLREYMTPMQNPEFGKKTLASLEDCFNYLYEMPESNKRVAVMGFCFGGTYSFNLTVHESRLKAAVVFYGHAEHDTDKLRQIACPVRAFYGENDERLIEGLDDLKTKMSEANVDFVAKVYPKTGHAFFNDSNSFAYNQEAARDAWQITLDFLDKSLS